MIIPNIQGQLDQKDFFIYAAGDQTYLERFGRPLINSVVRNTDYGVHLHVYNPSMQQIAWLSQQPRVSFTYEQFDPSIFDSAIKFWNRKDLPEPYLGRRIKTIGLKQYSDSADITAWIFKTYYACMRFVRLAEIVREPRRFLAIDIDGLVRAPFAYSFANDDQYDVYLYEKEKLDKKTGQVRKNGHLAGAILYTEKPQAQQFINDLAQMIRHEIEQENIYWFLDQNSLDAIIPNYRRGLLPMGYIDWKMAPESAIWTAKGPRKDLHIFVNELKKYA